MLVTYKIEEDFRHQCRINPIFDYWDAYKDLETTYDNHNVLLYKRIEKGLCEWLEENSKDKVFYNGDLNFEFETIEDRDRFDKECGDPVAFKLTYA